MEAVVSDAATATGLSSSISVSSNDDFQNYLSAMVVKFAYDSDDKQFVYGDNLCGDWILLGSWPTSVTGPTTSSTQYHFISTPSPLRLSPGFTEVCIVNTCGNCKCPNVIQFIGQLEIRGFSTSTPLGILPFRLRAEAVDDGGDSQTAGDWKLHAETSFVDMLNCVVSVNLFIVFVVSFIFYSCSYHSRWFYECTGREV